MRSHVWTCKSRSKLSTRRDAGGSNPLLSIASQGDRHPTLGANNVYFVVLDGQQHSAHFSQKAADDEAWKLSCELNYLQHPEEGRVQISVLSFTEMMESPVEMVI